MADIEKVIEGLECCKENKEDNPFPKCGDCPYNEISLFVDDCRAVLSADALEVIKSLHPIAP